MKARLRNLIGLALCLLALSCAVQVWPGVSAGRNSSRSHTPSQETADDLVKKGRERFQAYRCFECHGQNGEGTEDGADLRASTKTAEEVEKVLIRPSADADAKGMPAIPKDSPDLKPLVAYVMSLRPKLASLKGLRSQRGLGRNE